MTDKEIKNFFENFIKKHKNETLFEYEKGISEFALKNSSSKFRNSLERLLKDRTMNVDISFAIFVALCSRNRRNKDFAKYREILAENKNRFAGHDLYAHMELLCDLNTFDYKNMDDILARAKRNAEKMKESAGVLSAYADVVATSFEYAELLGEKPPKRSWIKAGFDAVDKAIEKEENYGKFRFIKARLLALEDKYDDAITLIYKAIDLENSSEQDYPLRVIDYRYHLQLIQIKRTSGKISENLYKGFSDKIQGTLLKNLEYIGLFAAIVSFTIGGLNIATRVSNDSLLGVGGLIIILMGSLLCVFSGFSIILHGKEEWLRSVIAFLVGGFIILVGVILAAYAQPIQIWNTNSEIVKVCAHIIGTIVSGI